VHITGRLETKNKSWLYCVISVKIIERKVYNSIMMLNISLAHGTAADHWHMALLRIFVKETAIQLGEERER
jgi:hypothetical protein